MTDEQLAEIEAREDKRLMLDMVAKIQRLEAAVEALAVALGPCASARDGDCIAKDCPQTVEGGKHYQSYCPRARYWESRWEAEGEETR